MNILHKKDQKEEKEDLGEKRWLSKKLFRRIFRLVNTSRGMFNMPKRQPCPLHGGKQPRVAKTTGGAQYRCNLCKSVFLVKRIGRDLN